ncbi:MAG: hypothetical protein ACUVWB_07700 [Anaerolineae bacterium]
MPRNPPATKPVGAGVWYNLLSSFGKPKLLIAISPLPHWAA